MKYCFFCGESYPDKTEMFARGTYNCCPNCNNTMKKGITLIGYTEKPTFENQGPISKIVSGDREFLAYPTSEYVTFSEDVAKNVFTDEMFEDIKKANESNGFVLIPDERIRELKNTYKQIKNPKSESDKQEA